MCILKGQVFRHLAQHCAAPWGAYWAAFASHIRGGGYGGGGMGRCSLLQNVWRSWRFPAFCGFFGLWEIGWNALTWYDIGIFNGMCVEVWVKTSYSHLYIAYVARKTGSIHNFQVAAMLFTESQGINRDRDQCFEPKRYWLRYSYPKSGAWFPVKGHQTLIKDKSGLFLKKALPSRNLT